MRNDDTEPETRGGRNNDTAVVVRCFGAFEVSVGSAAVTSWHAGKARQLFQYLLLNRGRIIRREKLFETLWPGGAWSRSSSSLKVAVHGLRRTLERAAGGAPDLRPVEVVSREHGYQLDATGLWLDIDEFDRALRAAHAAEARGARAEATACYRRAARLYTGDFLAGEDGDWVDEQRAYYRTRALHALTCLRADALLRGDHAEAVDACRRILEIDPYQEEVYQTLMVLHARRGELGQVRSWHRMCVRRLQRDLNVPPAETTRRIFIRAVRGELRAPEARTTRTDGARRCPAPRSRRPPGARPAPRIVRPRR